MATITTPDVKHLVGDHAEHCESRSLFATRFADPQAREDSTPSRQAWFQALGQKRPSCVRSYDWLPAEALLLHARLKSRLMVNMAGGVMENAGLHFDRYGLPVIPGSAVKGCARRMALQSLRQWTDAGRSDQPRDDPSQSCREGFDTPVAMLAAIANIFGWVEQDWDTGRNKDGTWKADFAWAVQGKTETLAAARAVLPATAASFAGTVAFLEGLPNRDPGIELDVVTPHHGDYYMNGRPVATDDENPVPVFFPAIRPQAEDAFFSFPIIPLRNDTLAAELALKWLRCGLEILGLGAKTNAGYGWFDASPEVNQAAEETKQARKERELKELQQQQEEDARKQADEEKLRARKELEAATEGMSEEEKAEWELQRLTADQLQGKLSNFPKLPGREQEALVRLFHGEHKELWLAFKEKAQKGKRAAIAEAIRLVSKKIGLGKMP